MKHFWPNFGLPAARFFAYTFLIVQLSSIACASVGAEEKNSLALDSLRTPYAGSPPRAQRIELGPRHTRALWKPATVAKNSQSSTPTVIMLTGSGPNGPEEASKAETTLSGKPELLFDQIAQPFLKQGVSVLQIGKPGVEFYDPLSQANNFYDLGLAQRTTWSDLVADVVEAVAFVKEQPLAEDNRIYILGHSEGTQVASDFVAQNSAAEIAGIVLLGFYGENTETVLTWQLFERNFELFIEPEMDPEHTGFIQKNLADKFTEFKWNWKPMQTSVPLAEVKEFARSDAKTKAYLAFAKSLPFYGNGIFARAAVFEQTAKLPTKIWALTGQLDAQTPVRNINKLKEECDKLGRTHCEAQVLPGVGHAFSAPKPPRLQMLLDATLGPIGNELLTALTKIAKHL